MSKKELHVLTRFFVPATGGLEISLLEIYKRLVSTGDYKIIVHTCTDLPNSKTKLAKFEIIEGIEVRRYSYLRFAFLWFTIPLPYFRKVVFSLHDLITFPFIGVMGWLWIIRKLRLTQARVVLSQHGMFNYDISMQPGLWMWLKSKVDRTIGVLEMNYVPQVIRAVSNSEKAGLVKAGVKSSLVRVIVNGVDENVFDQLPAPSIEAQNIINTSNPYIIQIARINKVKNQAAAIQVLPHIKDVKLVLMGPQNDIAYQQELQGLAKELGVEDRVSYIGVISGMDKFHLIRNAVATIHLSHAEGFALAIVEAMSQSSICIVTKDTAMEDQVNDGVNGYTVKPHDSVAIARRIQYIIDNKNLDELLLMKQRAQNFAKEHTWVSLSKEVDDMYTSLYAKK